MMAGGTCDQSQRFGLPTGSVDRWSWPLALDEDEKPDLYLVLSIYRDAKFKTKNDSSRRLQDQRPSASPLPWTTVAAAKMVRLHKVTSHGWACAGFTSSCTVDPLGVLLAEVSTVKQSWEPDRMVVRLSDSTIEAIPRAPDLLLIGTAGTASDEPTAPKAFAVGDFARSAPGLKNLEKFLQDVPAQHRALPRSRAARRQVIHVVSHRTQGSELLVAGFAKRQPCRLAERCAREDAAAPGEPGTCRKILQSSGRACTAARFCKQLTRGVAAADKKKPLPAR